MQYICYRIFNAYTDHINLIRYEFMTEKYFDIYV